ncbi:major facilitator superfamily domain-containing protein [Naematelia encephala]|uniref:Major facilitator superfamily domain-containing protein n=1 Tax=Naematelia encephala TaxID=71784 RepID=A0A1Y2B2F6_9TREE|nr:major facilitator superfamily domain-containing protein [Naematelia encephala]
MSHIEDTGKAELNHVDHAPSEDLLSGDDEARITKSVLWKLDTRMLPMLAVLFLFSFLDRTNIGNAKVLGLTTDLHLTGAQYANCLAIFFAFYIASEVPSNLVLKKISPRIWLGFLTAIWGVIGMCMGFARSYTGLMVVRAFLGTTEGGLLPGIVLFLSMMYKRSEIGFRLGLIYSSASLSGAFGGLLATGLYHIGPRGGLEGWRWILIIEGIMTVLVGLIAILVLPSTIDKARFFTPEERRVAASRLVADRPVGLTNTGEIVVLSEPFEWKRVWMGVFSVKTWLSALAYLAILTALYSFGLFVPTIVQGLGYTAVRAQLFSVPPYAVAAVLTVIAAYVSDRYKTRGPVMLAFLPISIVGYGIISHTTNLHVKYGALFLMAAGLYPSVPPVLVWVSGNTPNHWTRAVAIGLQLAVANCGGFPATFVYKSSESPVYKEAHTIVMGMLIAAWVLVAVKCAYLIYQNKQKEAGKREQFRGCGDDRDPEFKYII